LITSNDENAPAAELLGSLTRKPQNANQFPFCMNRNEKLDYQLATNKFVFHYHYSTNREIKCSNCSSMMADWQNM
jgi:hypothetical protein